MPRTIDPNAGQGHLKGSKASTSHQGIANIEWRSILQKLQGKASPEKPKQANPSWNNGRAKKPHYLRKGFKPKICEVDANGTVWWQVTPDITTKVKREDK